MERRALTSSLASSASLANIYGIALRDADQIAAGTDELSLRVRQVLGIVATLSQYRQLAGSLRGLPHVAGLWEVEGGVVHKVGRGLSEVDNERGIPLAGAQGVSKGQEEECGEGERPLSPLREESEETSKDEETEVWMERLLGKPDRKIFYSSLSLSLSPSFSLSGQGHLLSWKPLPLPLPLHLSH